MRKFGVLLTMALLLALVPAVLAGGWAVITLDDMPGEIHAGEPWVVGFTVLQHGETPIHKFEDGTPIEPTLVATNAATGRRIEAVATPTKEVGHFTLEVTFPSEGEWEWTIFPAPLAGETQYEPLNVLPATAAVAPIRAADAQAGAVVAPAAAPAAEPAPVATIESSPSTLAVLRWGALVIALLAAALFVVQTRRRTQPAGVES